MGSSAARLGERAQAETLKPSDLSISAGGLAMMPKPKKPMRLCSGLIIAALRHSRALALLLLVSVSLPFSSLSQKPASPADTTHPWTVKEIFGGESLTGEPPSGLSWSPDGTSIALTSRGDVYVIDADGREPRPVTWRSGDEVDPAWRPIPNLVDSAP